MREDLPALTIPLEPQAPATDAEIAASRRRLRIDSLGIIVTAIGFGLVYGLAARAAGFSPIEASGMSVLVFAGAAQFAAIGYILGGFSWVAVMVLTAFLNARHFLYGAALAPYLADRPRAVRALMAHVLTDEAFALTIAHFRRIRQADMPGFWWAAIVTVFIPWNIATIVGVLVGGQIPDPSQFGLDVIFPAAMAGLAVGLVTGRRELVAAVMGAVVAVGVGLASDPAAGIIAGGLVGPAVGMVTPRARGDRPHEAVIVFTPRLDDPSMSTDGDAAEGLASDPAGIGQPPDPAVRTERRP
ncbi:MAG: branched-chain amino acid ABC transporter permease [Chloroflexota bacterium]|nr:MAG: branched-chain amino acid ABC transporter permease [Chloroflexota bacterium]